MVIRMKGKHLVATGVILLITLFIIVNFGGHLLYQYAILLDRMGYTEKANVYYSRISENYSKNDSGIMAEYKRMQNIIKEGNFRYSEKFSIIIGGSITNSGYIGYKTVDDINARYETMKTNNAANRKLMAEYTMATALVNWFGGRSDRAVELLEALEPDNERLQAFKKLHLANMYFYLGEIEKSLQSIADMKPQSGLEGYQEDIEVLNRLFTGESEIVYEHPMIYQYDPHGFDCLEEPLKFTRSLIDALQSFIAKTKDGTGGNTLSGRITLDGKPQQNLMVYVKDAEYQNGWSSTIGRGDGLVGLGISDNEGYFKITGIPDGVYGLTMYIPWQRISGKNISFHSEFDMILKGNTERVENITLSYPIQIKVEETDNSLIFQWSEDQLQEETCSLSLSELQETDGMLYRTNNSYYLQQVKGNGLTVNIKEAQKTAYRLGISYGGKLDPMEYIEPLYHSGQYGYTLYCFQGNNMLHYTNEGIYPNRPPAQLTIRGSEWTTEDLLLLEGKFEEARAAYEVLLETDPQNIHALKVLSRMYDSGYIAQEGEPAFNLGGKDEERALELLQRLDTLVGGEHIKSALADQYLELKQYEKAIELMHIVQNINPSPYTEMEIGRIHLYMNRFAKSVEYFQRYTHMTGSGTLYTFMPAILMNDVDLLTESAGAYKTLIHTDINDLVDAYNVMQKEEYKVFFKMVAQNRAEEAQRWLDGRDDDLGEFLKAVFLLTRDTNGMSYEEKENTFRQYHKQIQSPVLDELLIYLGRELINSAYGTPMD